MKKVFLFLLILILLFGGYLFCNYMFGNKIPVLDIEESVAIVDELIVYGTHLNLHGNIDNNADLDLVLYNGEFIAENINIDNGEFYLSDKINEGIYLEDIPRGDYYLFLREKVTSEKNKDTYKYSSISNSTKYKETKYFTSRSLNNMIVINSEESYPTMMIHVSENKNSNIYDIVIDPGHGGMDSGSNKNGYKESDMTLKIANKLRKKLEDDGFKVKLTHETGDLTTNEVLDEYGKHGRAVIPYEVHAKYVLSIHMNSNKSPNVNGLEVYTAENINYDLAKLLVKNITEKTGIKYSGNQINKIDNSIYTRNFTETDIAEAKKEKESKNLVPYDITTKSNYYYMIRETGGIMTGAYVDDRNSSISANPYIDSNVGSETYLLELGYLSNRSDLDNMLNKMDLYVEAMAISLESQFKTNE